MYYKLFLVLSLSVVLMSSAKEISRKQKAKRSNPPIQCASDPDCKCVYFSKPCIDEFSTHCFETHYCDEVFEKPCCKGKPCEKTIDLVYAVDESGSIGYDNFDKIKDFMQDINKKLKIGADNVRVAVEKFGSDNVYVIQLNEKNKNGDVTKLNKVIEDMSYYRSGETFTGKALQGVRTKMLTPANGDRSDVFDIVLLCTDGKATDPNLALQEANLLKKQGVTMFSIGIGSSIEKIELEQIASESCAGTGKLVFTADFDELDKIVDSIVKEACSCA